MDHIAIAPTGVYVIDAKAWHGKVAAPTPLFGRHKLLIDGRDRTSLIDGLDRQVEVVRAALAKTTVSSRCAACCASRAPSCRSCAP